MQLTTLLSLASLTILPVLALDKPLNIEVTHKVSCSHPTKRGDRVDVHYRGTLESGTEFDASYNRGQPLGFMVGKGQVIKGWDEGLLDMCPGEKRLLTIQPEWAYGERGTGPIPGNSVLIFETELVDIVGVKQETVKTEEQVVEEQEEAAEEAEKKEEL